MPEIKAYTSKDLQLMYEVSRKTIYRWYFAIIDTAGIRNGHRFTPKQVEIFFDCWGEPKYNSPEEALKKLKQNNT